MSIFGKIKDAIFGDRAEAAEPAVGPTDSISGAVGAATSAMAAAAAIASTVDVDAILSGQAAEKNLNWRTSIVDLLKLVGLDPSLANRKELAQELGYSGALDGSAEMNMWLHKAVMRGLAANGGTVPAELTD